jgi:hypothetical protein
MMLYKYRKINDNTTKILTNGEIYFSKPSEFNDPFDCERPITLECKETDLKEFMRNRNITNKTLLELRETINDFLNKNGRELSKYKEFIESQKDELKYVQILLKDIFRVFCLSESYKKILMWSHYADNHKGICIGFNIPNTDSKGNPYLFNEITLNDNRNQLNLIYDNKKIDLNKLISKKVIYDNSIIRRTSIFEPDATNSKHANYYKFKDWEYEEEYRFITNSNFQTGILDPQYITKIFFGCKTTEKDICKTIQEIKKSDFLDLKKVNFYRMEQSEDCFKIKERLIDINKIFIPKEYEMEQIVRTIKRINLNNKKGKEEIKKGIPFEFLLKKPKVGDKLSFIQNKSQEVDYIEYIEVQNSKTGKFEMQDDLYEYYLVYLLTSNKGVMEIFYCYNKIQCD